MASHKPSKPSPYGRVGEALEGLDGVVPFVFFGVLLVLAITTVAANTEVWPWWSDLMQEFAAEGKTSRWGAYQKYAHKALWFFFSYLALHISISEIRSAGRFALMTTLGGMWAPVALTFIVLMIAHWGWGISGLTTAGAGAIALAACATDVAFSLSIKKMLRAELVLMGVGLLLLALGDDVIGVVLMTGVYAKLENPALVGAAVLLLGFCWFLGEGGKLSIRRRQVVLVPENSESKTTTTTITDAAAGTMTTTTTMVVTSKDAEGKGPLKRIEGPVIRTELLTRIEHPAVWLALAVVMTILVWDVEAMLGGCFAFFFAPDSVKEKLARWFKLPSAISLLIFGASVGSINIMDIEMWGPITFICLLGGHFGKSLGVTSHGHFGKRLLAPDSIYRKMPLWQLYSMGSLAGINGTVAIIFIMAGVAAGFILGEHGQQAVLGYFLTIPLGLIEVKGLDWARLLKESPEFQEEKQPAESGGL